MSTPSGDRLTMRFGDLADRLLDLPGPHPIVAIDGPGGAGKSTFADRLVASIEKRVEPRPIIIVEGVSASRSEWLDHLAFSVWIHAGPDVCRDRGIRRDGVSAGEWDQAARTEAAFFVNDGAADRADLIVDSSATTDDSEISFVALA